MKHERNPLRPVGDWHGGEAGYQVKDNHPQHSRPQRTRQGRDGRSVALFDGRIALGIIHQSAGRYTAVTPTGRVLGCYATQAAAANALQRWSER